MSTTISIPLSFLFSPITLPIALVRLAVASVVAVIISPISAITAGIPIEFQYDATFGYARKYTILETKQMVMKREKYLNSLFFEVQKVRVRPGIIPYIAGAKPKIEKMWKSDFNQPFLEDGTEPSHRLVTGVENARKVDKKRKLRLKTQKTNLEAVRNAVETL